VQINRQIFTFIKLDVFRNARNLVRCRWLWCYSLRQWIKPHFRLSSVITRYVNT